MAFAEVEEFLDTPVKRYSSGMYVRLAFAVAGHLEPEILLVDEVLAVGDVAFQNKCLGKMGEVAHSGRTVVFVSHNMGMIAELCQRAVCLDQGRVRTVGPAQQVIASYVESHSEAEPRWVRPDDAAKSRVRVQSVRILSQKGEPLKVVDFQEPFQVEIVYDVYEPVQGCTVSFRLRNAEGLSLWVSSERDSTTLEGELRKAGRYRAVCEVHGRFLRHGRYSLSVGAYIENKETIDQHENLLSFAVSPVGCPAMDGRAGAICPVLPWRVGFSEGRSGCERGNNGNPPAAALGESHNARGAAPAGKGAAAALEGVAAGALGAVWRLETSGADQPVFRTGSWATH